MSKYEVSRVSRAGKRWSTLSFVFFYVEGRR